jgi:hypothetical protein
MKRALFVEGSLAAEGARNSLEMLWNELLCDLAGIQRFDVIYGISKANIVAMDPSVRDLSGAAEPFDALLERKVQTDGVEAAVVAWDLIPKWNGTASPCRWEETLGLYRGLSQSPILAGRWKASAQTRLSELEGRDWPGQRQKPLILQKNSVWPLAMEPMFEHLIMQDESLARKALQVDGTQVPGWPKKWNDGLRKQPDQKLLAPIIASLHRMRESTPVQKVGLRYRNGKNEWGEYITRQLLLTPGGREALVGHPMVTRLAELR